MTTFALISEGLTDQIILEQIIVEMCKEAFDEGIDVNPLQPLRDATDGASGKFGGWELVLECCGHRVEAALEANDYVVIHLDTDEGDHPNFGLPLTKNGIDRQYDCLVNDAIKIIAKRLGANLYDAYLERFLFAISVHSMESWLLLYICDVNAPKNSLKRLNYHRRKQNKKVLKKEATPYREIAREIKRKRLINLSGQNHSLGVFLERLSKIAG